MIRDGGVCCGRDRVSWRTRSSVLILVEVRFFVAFWSLAISHTADCIRLDAPDWRRTLPSSTDDQQSFALYARILSLFFDTPSPLCPFSVHAFALHGKSLGKEVGEWFGPSTAAGAIKALVNGWDGAGMEVVEGSDGTIYRDEVAATSCGKAGEDWSRPVLVLIGLRLGIDGVTPVYYDSIKVSTRSARLLCSVSGLISCFDRQYFLSRKVSVLQVVDRHRRTTLLARKQTTSSTSILIIRNRSSRWSFRPEICGTPQGPSRSDRHRSRVISRRNRRTRSSRIPLSPSNLLAILSRFAVHPLPLFHRRRIDLIPPLLPRSVTRQLFRHDSPISSRRRIPIRSRTPRFDRTTATRSGRCLSARSIRRCSLDSSSRTKRTGTISIIWSTKCVSFGLLCCETV